MRVGKTNAIMMQSQWAFRQKCLNSNRCSFHGDVEEKQKQNKWWSLQQALAVTGSQSVTVQKVPVTLAKIHCNFFVVYRIVTHVTPTCT